MLRTELWSLEDQNVHLTTATVPALDEDILRDTCACLFDYYVIEMIDPKKMGFSQESHTQRGEAKSLGQWDRTLFSWEEPGTSVDHLRGEAGTAGWDYTLTRPAELCVTLAL